MTCQLSAGGVQLCMRWFIDLISVQRVRCLSRLVLSLFSDLFYIHHCISKFHTRSSCQEFERQCAIWESALLGQFAKTVGGYVGA